MLDFRNVKWGKYQELEAEYLCLNPTSITSEIVFHPKIKDNNTTSICGSLGIIK